MYFQLQFKNEENLQNSHKITNKQNVLVLHTKLQLLLMGYLNTLFCKKDHNVRVVKDSHGRSKRNVRHNVLG